MAGVRPACELDIFPPGDYGVIRYIVYQYSV